MNITEIMQLVDHIKLYDKGTHMMWTDPYISKQLLEMHLSPDIELASRNPKLIERTIDWLVKEVGSETKKILDLGCGPGLYTTRLARKGYDVVGIDFSQNSLAYAKEEAKKNDLDIKYIYQNYLEMNFEQEFDLITMIYCDFGVLSTSERERLLAKIYKALKPGGCFIFDIPNSTFVKAMNFTNQWEMSNGGFWSPEPYICLSTSSHFPENQALVDQHVVINQQNDYRLYRFWQHYFNKEDVENSVRHLGFKGVEEYCDILEAHSTINFYKIQK